MIFMLWQMQIVTRTLWVHPLNNLREEKGEFYSLFPDLRHYNKQFFKLVLQLLGNIPTSELQYHLSNGLF